jgi:hypothetical protein
VDFSLLLGGIRHETSLRGRNQPERDKMKSKKKTETDELDKFLFHCGEGLTPDLIKIRNEQMRDEYLKMLEETGMEDSLGAYKAFVGHKLSVLFAVVEHLVRFNEKEFGPFE